MAKTKINHKVFTIEEAHAMIPDLEIRLKRLIEKKENYTRRHDELLMSELLQQAEHRSGLQTEDHPLEEEIHTLEASVLALEKDLKEIQNLGCIVRDIEKGRVDFLGKHNNEFVYFCWILGEKKIKYYHSLKGGMKERKPID